MLTSAILVIGVSCEGEQGPEGPAGPAGPQGPQGATGLPGPPGEGGAGTGSAAEIYFAEIDFNSANGYQQILEFNPELEIEASDVLLVYKFAGFIEGETPEEDILYWEPLPSTVFLEEGTIQYKFDHSYIELWLYMKATFDLSVVELEDFYTDGILIRIVVIPGEIIPPSEGRSLAPVDYSNYEEVVKYYNLDENNVREIFAK